MWLRKAAGRSRKCYKEILILVDFPPSMSTGSQAQKHEFCLHIERASASQAWIYCYQQEGWFTNFPLKTHLLSGQDVCIDLINACFSCRQDIEEGKPQDKENQVSTGGPSGGTIFASPA